MHSAHCSILLDTSMHAACMHDTFLSNEYVMMKATEINAFVHTVEVSLTCWRETIGCVAKIGATIKYFLRVSPVITQMVSFQCPHELEGEYGQFVFFFLYAHCCCCKDSL